MAVGVSMATGWKWFAHAGGVRPKFPGEGPRKRPRMTLDERVGSRLVSETQESIASIARRLGRAPSTIMREINESVLLWAVIATSSIRSPVAWRRMPNHAHRATGAQARTQERARRPRRASWRSMSGCMTRCRLGLRTTTALSRIARRLMMDFPDSRCGRLRSNDLPVDLCAGPRQSAPSCIPAARRRALRQPQRRAEQRRGRIQTWSISVSAHQRWLIARCWALGGRHASGSKQVGDRYPRRARQPVCDAAASARRPRALAVQQAIVAEMAQLPAVLREP